MIRLVVAHDELAGLFIGDIQHLAEGPEALVALHAELGHEAPGPVVEPGVDHAAVAAAGAHAHVQLLFRHGHFEVVAAQGVGDGAAYAAPAHDQYVIVHHLHASLKTVMASSRVKAA